MEIGSWIFAICGTELMRLKPHYSLLTLLLLTALIAGGVKLCYERHVFSVPL